MKRTFLLLLATVAACGCAARRPAFTHGMRELHALGSADLKRVQFYVSDTIELEREVRTDQLSISPEHTLKTESDRRIEQVKIAKGTPCIVVESGPYDLAVSFEEGRSLLFGFHPGMVKLVEGTTDTAKYMLQSDWHKEDVWYSWLRPLVAARAKRAAEKPEVMYGNRKFRVISRSSQVHLLIDQDQLENLVMEMRTPGGMTPDGPVITEEDAAAAREAEPKVPELPEPPEAPKLPEPPKEPEAPEAPKPAVTAKPPAKEPSTPAERTLLDDILDPVAEPGEPKVSPEKKEPEKPKEPERKEPEDPFAVEPEKKEPEKPKEPEKKEPEKKEPEDPFAVEPEKKEPEKPKEPEKKEPEKKEPEDPFAVEPEKKEPEEPKEPEKKEPEKKEPETKEPEKKEPEKEEPKKKEPVKDPFDFL